MIGQAKRLYELNRIADISTTEKSPKKIYAVTSGKGGVGKTFVSLNVAMALAELGKKTLVIDLDFNLSNVNVLLNSASGNNLQKYFANQKSIEELIFEYHSNLHFIFGDSGEVDFPEVTEQMLYGFFRDIKNSIAENYDFILLDLSPGASNNVISVLKLSDEIILLTTPEPTSVMDSYVIVKLLKANEIGKEINVIVNKADKNSGEIAYQNLSQATTHFLETEVKYLGNIGLNENITQSIMEQKPFYKTYKSSKTAMELESLAQKLIKINHLVNNSQP